LSRRLNPTALDKQTDGEARRGTCNSDGGREIRECSTDIVIGKPMASRQSIEDAACWSRRSERQSDSVDDAIPVAHG
jgi:hypothetical protein